MFNRYFGGAKEIKGKTNLAIRQFGYMMRVDEQENRLSQNV